MPSGAAARAESARPLGPDHSTARSLAQKKAWRSGRRRRREARHIGLPVITSRATNVPRRNSLWMAFRGGRSFEDFPGWAQLRTLVHPRCPIMDSKLTLLRAKTRG